MQPKTTHKKRFFLTYGYFCGKPRVFDKGNTIVIAVLGIPIEIEIKKNERNRSER
jgi:hypothetical protein